MSKTINIFGFHGIESLLQNNPELVLKVLIQNERNDKRIIDLINKLGSQKISFFIKSISSKLSNSSIVILLFFATSMITD